MFDLNSDLNSYLASGERVLWQGQGKRRINPSTMGSYFFIAIFVAFALILGGLFVTLASSSRDTRSNGSAVFISLSIIFVAVGLGVGVPWALSGSRASNARYFVTNLAALIVYTSARSGKRMTIVPLKNLQQLTLHENRDGTGTLTLASSPYAAYGRYSNSWSRDAVPTFADIERPLEVYQLIRRQMDELNSR
jgi:hypothetical protein